MALPEKWQHVVFAQAVNLDVLHQHHLVVTHAEHGAVQEFFRILVVAASQKAQRLLKTLGSVPQTVAIRILPDQLDHPPHQIGDGLRFPTLTDSVSESSS